MSEHKKKNLFWRYLLSLLFPFIPLLIRIILLVVGMYIYDFISGMNFQTLVILILLGVISVPIFFSLIYIIGMAIYYIGKKIMQLSLNKIVFWCIFTFTAISFLDMFLTPGYSLVEESENVTGIPMGLDILVTSLIMLLYGLGAKAQSDEESIQYMDLSNQIKN